MAELPPTGEGPGAAWWMGLTGLIGSLIAGLGMLYEKFRSGREKDRITQADLDKQAKLTQDELEEKEATRKEKERTWTIIQWQEVAHRQDLEITRLNAALEVKDGQNTALQSAVNSLYRQCSGLEVELTRREAEVVFYHALAKRLASCLKEKNLPCEEVPEPPPRIPRPVDHEGPDYTMRVVKQNVILTDAAQKIIGGKGEA